jgi:hypothetical protein
MRTGAKVAIGAVIIGGAVSAIVLAARKRETSAVNGTLNITTDPAGASAEIFTDENLNNSLGIFITPASASLPAGNYYVLLTLSGYVTLVVPISITADSVTSEHIDMWQNGEEANQTGTLYITTNPAADIYLYSDSGLSTIIDQATSSLSASLSPGTYYVKIIADGYDTITEEITITVNSTVTKNYNLTPTDNGGDDGGDDENPVDYGIIRVSTSPPAYVIIYERSDYTVIVSEQASPTDFSLDPATYYMEVSLSGYESYRTPLTVSAGDNRDIAVVLQQLSESGTLSVTSDPDGATVKIYDQSREVLLYTLTSPLSIELPVGTYRVNISKADYDDHEETISIENNETTEMNVTLPAEEHYTFEFTNGSFSTAYSGGVGFTLYNYGLKRIEGDTWHIGVEIEALARCIDGSYQMVTDTESMDNRIPAYGAARSYWLGWLDSVAWVDSKTGKGKWQRLIEAGTLDPNDTDIQIKLRFSKFYDDRDGAYSYSVSNMPPAKILITKTGIVYGG